MVTETHQFDIGTFLATEIEGMRVILRVDVADAFLGPQAFYGVRPIQGPDNQLILADAARIEAMEEVDANEIPYEHRVHLRAGRAVDARGRSFDTIAQARDANYRHRKIADINARYETGKLTLLKCFVEFDELPSAKKAADLFTTEEIRLAGEIRATKAAETQVSGIADNYHVWVDVWKGGKLLGTILSTWRECCQLIAKHKSLASPRLYAKWEKRIEGRKENGWME